MSQRFDACQMSPDGYQAMLGLNAAVKKSGLEHGLLELIKIRASQINGCAFCIAMHVQEARRLGISENHLLLLPAWREAPIYSARERAALAWTEALVHLTDGHVPDAVYGEVSEHFSTKEVSDLVYAIVEITGWNRLMIASRTPPLMEEGRE